MTPATLLVDSLAAYRIVRLVQRDRMPPLPTWRVRLSEAAGNAAWGELLECAWCAGVHAAAAVTLARRAAPRAWSPLAVILAGSAAVGLLTAAEDALDTAGSVTEYLA